MICMTKLSFYRYSVLNCKDKDLAEALDLPHVLIVHCSTCNIYFSSELFWHSHHYVEFIPFISRSTGSLSTSCRKNAVFNINY